MPQAILKISIPEDLWIGQLTRNYSEANFRVLSAISADEKEIRLLEISEADLDEILTQTEEESEIREVKVIGQQGNIGLIQLEVNEPILLRPIINSRIPLRMPLKFNNGKVIWKKSTSQKRFSQLQDELSEFDFQYEIEEIRNTRLC